MRKIEVAFDTSHPSSQEELQCLPVLSLRDVHRNAKIKATQVHGILLRYAKLPNKTTNDRFQCVGYFWTASRTVVDALQGRPLSYIEIV